MNNQHIILVSDDIRMCSGVGNQARHVCKKLINNGYKVINIGMTIDKPQPPVHYKLDTGEEMEIIQTNKLDDISLVISTINRVKPSCVVLFTDPHRFAAIWANATAIRKTCPIVHIAVWDTYLLPQPQGPAHFNLPIYENCDSILCISKQTEWFINEVFKKVQYSTKPDIRYVGHGSDTNTFKPLKPEEYKQTKDRLFQGKDFKFVVMMLNRNQGRKKFPDLIEAWRLFIETLLPEQAKECLLVLCTELVSGVGTNLVEVAKAIAPNANIQFIVDKNDENTVNQFYNIADVIVNCSNAEGYGLSANEGILAGKPVILNMTGGLVDQAGYRGDWSIERFNNLNTLPCGSWCYPLFGQRTITGTPMTFYLYDYNASIDSITAGLKYWYDKPDETRQAEGLKGREWLIKQGQTAKSFSESVVLGISDAIANFKPQPLFKVYQT